MPIAMGANRPLSTWPDAESTSSLSEGTNALLRLGAIPLTRVDDVLEAIGIAVLPRETPAPGGKAVSAVLAALDGGAATAEEAARATGLTRRAVAAARKELELAGVVVGRSGVYRR